MLFAPSRKRLLAVVAVLTIVLACSIWAFGLRTYGQPRPARAAVALFTSLPILWGEHDGVQDMLASPGSRHWARDVLEERGPMLPLDTLLDLSRARRLVIAQPRPLAPEENVALDAWVRGGGRLLLFADPMLTQESRFALGDRRRPQDVVLLSPILARWGLQLRYDDSAVEGVRENAGEGIPVNLPGELAVVSGGFDSHCAIGPEALVAQCKIGQGQALIIADAALIETGADEELRAGILARLLDEAFAPSP